MLYITRLDRERLDKVQLRKCFEIQVCVVNRRNIRRILAA